jgi:hypothetical protein
MVDGTRRQFLATGSALLAGVCYRISALGQTQSVAVRATSGDRQEPRWSKALTITVGPAGADLVGRGDRVIQAGVDYIHRLGGGTVEVLPGTYRLHNAVYLASGVRVLGHGEETVLIKEPSRTTKLVADSDWYDQEITLTDAGGFEVGYGVCLRGRNPHNGGNTVVKRTLVARDGKRFKLDRPLRDNLWLQGEASASTLFPLLSGENVNDVVIENICLDGNKANNANLDGNYAGCIFLQDCNRVTIRGVTARNYNGDGISWQVCHDVTAENCHSHDHTGLGMHPGSGSQRSIIRNNRIEHNDIGLFFCWGVKFGLAEKNVIEESRSAGISIGHRDTDNLVRDNVIRRSGRVGILFRPETDHARSPNRNHFELNQVIDSGPESGVGIDIQGETEGATLTRNELRETRGAGQRIGIRIGAKTRNIHLSDNRIEGFAVPVSDLRSGKT